MVTTFDFDASSLPAGWSTPFPGGGSAYSFSRGYGSTPSTETGPSSGSSGGGYYYFAEASNPRAQGDLFTLGYDGSACSTLSGVASISFKYHMYGRTMGTLQVCTSDGTVVWSLSGDQLNTWHTGNAGLDSSSFYFKYQRGSDYYGDVRGASLERDVMCPQMRSTSQVFARLVVL